MLVRLRRNMFSKKLLKDVAERAVWTAVQTFLAVYTFGGTDELKSAGIASVAAALSAVKGFLATSVGNSNSASTIKEV